MFKFSPMCLKVYPMIWWHLISKLTLIIPKSKFYPHWNVSTGSSNYKVGAYWKKRSVLSFWAPFGACNEFLVLLALTLNLVNIKHIYASCGLPQNANGAISCKILRKIFSFNLMAFLPPRLYSESVLRTPKLSWGWKANSQNWMWTWMELPSCGVKLMERNFKGSNSTAL